MKNFTAGNARHFLLFFLSFLFLLPLKLPGQCLNSGGTDPSRVIAFDEFMGTNLLRADPIQYVGCVGIVREYHSWVVVEAGPPYPSYPTVPLDPNYNMPVPGVNYPYPENIYNWAPALPGASTIQSFDLFYQALRDQGVQICGTLTGSAGGVASNTNTDNLKSSPAYLDADGNYCPAMPFTPGSVEETTNPMSFLWRGDYVSQYVNRYGNPTTPLNADQDKNSGADANADTWGLIDYVENWNEPDNEYQWEFTPQEYAVMTSVDFDGFAGFDASSMPIYLQGQKGCANPDFYPIGVDNRGLPFVMGGLTTLDDCYLEDVLEWFNANRGGSRSGLSF